MLFESSTVTLIVACPFLSFLGKNDKLFVESSITILKIFVFEFVNENVKSVSEVSESEMLLFNIISFVVSSSIKKLLIESKFGEFAAIVNVLFEEAKKLLPVLLFA